MRAPVHRRNPARNLSARVGCTRGGPSTRSPARRSGIPSDMAVTAGERRLVSVLMADVAGSTAIGEALGPERSKFLFDEVVRLMAERVREYGGTVAQLQGDGLLALFGAPVA